MHSTVLAFSREAVVRALEEVHADAVASSEAYITHAKGSFGKDHTVVSRNDYTAISEKELDEWYLDVFTKCFGEDLDVVRRDTSFSGDPDSVQTLLAAIRAGRHDIIGRVAAVGEKDVRKRFDIDAFIRGELRRSDIPDLAADDEAPKSAALKSLRDETIDFAKYLSEQIESGQLPEELRLDGDANEPKE